MVVIGGHQKSKSHELNMLCGETVVSDENGEFQCKRCNYSTSRKGNFRKHVLSTKHVAARNNPVPVSENAQLEIKPVMLMEFMAMILKQQENQKNTIYNKSPGKSSFGHLLDSKNVQNRILRGKFGNPCFRNPRYPGLLQVSGGFHVVFDQKVPYWKEEWGSMEPKLIWTFIRIRYMDEFLRYMDEIPAYR